MLFLFALDASASANINVRYPVPKPNTYSLDEGLSQATVYDIVEDLHGKHLIHYAAGGAAAPTGKVHGSQ